MNLSDIPDFAVASAIRRNARRIRSSQDDDQGSTDTLQAALFLAQEGFSVHPLARGRKTPTTTRGFHDASSEPDTVKKLFRGKQLNIGIATGQISGVIVIDVDTYRGGDLQALEQELGPLPPTRMVRTRAGGQHHYFRQPGKVSLRCHNGEIAPYVDLKGDGGYVVAPPSFVEADEKGPAGTYEWENALPISELPERWIQRWQEIDRGAHRADVNDDLTGGVRAAYRPPDRAPEGQRNEALLRYVGALRAKGLEETLVLNAATDFNRARCTPPLDDTEVVDIVGRYAKQTPTNTTVWSDPKPIDAPLPPVRALNLDMLPESFRAYVQDQADLMQCPPEYIAVPLMVAAAAALGNKIAIAPKAHDEGWLVVPVLWGAVVGRPGSMKSPAHEVAMRPLANIEASLADSYNTNRAQYQNDRLLYEAALAAAKKSAAKGQPIAGLPLEPEEPQPERLQVNDSTVQKLGEILRWSPRGVLVVRDELVSLLEQLGAEGQEGARAFYLTGWNGSSDYRVDRVGRGSFIIHRMALWLCGGIQPGKLQPYIRQAVSGGNGDDGLLQRVQLIVWPDLPQAWQSVDRQPDLAAMQQVDDVFFRLRQVNPVTIGCISDDPGNRPAWLHFTSEAQIMFDAWREKLESTLRKGEMHPALESHLAKYRSLIPALALVIHLADGQTGPVGMGPLQRAIQWCGYLLGHAKRVYASATHASSFSAKALADRIRTGKLGSGFTAREVQRHGWSYLTTPEDVRAAVDWLVDAGWVRADRAGPSSTGGRPTETYAVNPRVRA